MKQRIIAVFLSLMMLMSMLPMTALAAKTGTTVHYEHNFDSAPLSSSFTTNNAGFGMSFATGRWKVVSGSDAIRGRTPLINTADLRWWSVSYFEEQMCFSFDFKADKLFSGNLAFSVNTQDEGTSTEGMGGTVISLSGTGGPDGKVTVKDHEGKKVATLEQGKHSVKILMTRTERTYAIEIDGEVVSETSCFKSKTYSIHGMRFDIRHSSSNGYVGLDNFKAYTIGRVPPQTHSYQEPGAMPEVIIPAEKEDRIYAYLNKTEIDLSGKKAIYEDGTVFLPLAQTALAAGLTLTSGDAGQTILTGGKATAALKPDLKTVRIGSGYIALNHAPKIVDGALYVPLQLFAELLDAKVWYDANSKTCLITTGDYKTDGILRAYNGKFFMNGEIYYEISFNKFDLNMQLDADPTFEGGTKYEDATWNNAASCLAGAEKALKELSENSFKTIRVFCSSINPGKKKSEIDLFYKRVDQMYDLCDQYGIKVVACMLLWTEEFMPGEYVNGAWINTSNENFTDYFTNEKSQARQNAYAFLKDYVNRYRERDTILMWEICNEGSLQVDVGGATGGISYSILQLAQFYNDFGRKFHEYDPERLVTSGDSMLRSAQWGLFEGVMSGTGAVNWAADTPEERLKAYTFLYEVLDVISMHGYDVGVSLNNGHGIVNIDGKDTLIDHEFYVKECERLNKPLYNGESGGMMGGSAENTSPNAGKFRGKYLEDLVKAGVQLTHWWTYGSNRNGGFGNDFDSWNVTVDETSSTFKAIKNANADLKKKWIVNGAKEENTTLVASGTFVTYDGTDLAIPETEGTSEAPGDDKGGCFGTLSGALPAALLAAGACGMSLGKKKKKD